MKQEQVKELDKAIRKYSANNTSLFATPIRMEHVLWALKMKMKELRKDLPDREDKSDPYNAKLFSQWDRIRYWFDYLHTDPVSPWKLGKNFELQSKPLIETLFDLLVS